MLSWDISNKYIKGVSEETAACFKSADHRINDGCRRILWGGGEQDIRLATELVNDLIVHGWRDILEDHSTE